DGGGGHWHKAASFGTGERAPAGGPGRGRPAGGGGSGPVYRKGKAGLARSGRTGPSGDAVPAALYVPAAPGFSDRRGLRASRLRPVTRPARQVTPRAGHLGRGPSVQDRHFSDPY